MFTRIKNNSLNLCKINAKSRNISYKRKKKKLFEGIPNKIDLHKYSRNFRNFFNFFQRSFLIKSEKHNEYSTKFIPYFFGLLFSWPQVHESLIHTIYFLENLFNIYIRIAFYFFLSRKKK